MMERNSMEHDRLRGLFWGLVVGDCLGSPIQFTGKNAHPYITEMEPCAMFGTPPGYWTDDSSMAFCIAESYGRIGRIDIADIGNNFVRWIRDGFWSSKSRAFDVGGATDAAVWEIEHRGTLRNGTEDSQGNGSIMRFAPAYLISRSLPEEERRKARHAISDLTHCSARVREVVDDLSAILDEHVAGTRTMRRSLYATREEVNNSGWAVSTLEAALWAFQTTDSFEDALIAAVNLGGDADSIGAVCGQIAGAYYGYSAIPERWIAPIPRRSEIDALVDGCTLKEMGNA